MVVAAGARLGRYFGSGRPGPFGIVEEPRPGLFFSPMFITSFLILGGFAYRPFTPIPELLGENSRPRGTRGI